MALGENILFAEVGVYKRLVVRAGRAGAKAEYGCDVGKIAFIDGKEVAVGFR